MITDGRSRKLTDLTGRQFGRLCAVQRVENTKTGNSAWLCRCECGREKTIRASSLRSGNTKSCGCLSENGEYSGLPVGINYVIRSYKTSAKKRGFIWELSKYEAFNLISGNCYYCGLPGSNSHFLERKDKERVTYGGIDRKDPSKGYILDNCVSCCSRCNYLKASMDYEGFLNSIKSIYEHLLAKHKPV